MPSPVLRGFSPFRFSIEHPYLPISGIIHGSQLLLRNESPVCLAHEIGGTEDHLHLCVRITPTLLISEFVGQLNGSSAHEANQKVGHKVLEWQAGYGVVSFGTKDLPWVNEYVRNQKERQANRQTANRLERINAI